MAVEIWQPKMVGWLWLGILLVTGAVYGGIYLTGGCPEAYYYALAVPGSIILGLMLFSLAMRGTHGWGWIPLGLVLALAWGLVHVLFMLLSFLGSSRYYRRGRW